MTYERVQKSSSWIPQPTKKKSHFAPQPFTVQTKRGKTDKPQAPAYAPVADDWVTNNPLMRSIQTAENKEAQALQRQEESEDKDDLQMLSQEGTIQRQCDSCDSQVSSEQEKQPIQAKLSLGQPGDKYEQEADTVARQVVNKINAPPTQPSVQRQSQSGGTSQLNITLMRHSEGSVGGGSSVTPEVEQNIQQSRGSGQPLDASVREPMQQAFGTDFSGVKIHTNSQSDQLNRSLSARAFTTGSDIFFKQGEYNPGSRDGQELLAHELTHVVQQTGGVQAKFTNTPTGDEPKQEPIPVASLTEPKLQAQDDGNGWWDSIRRGWDVYWGMNDEGAFFARQLMQHYLLGFGSDFENPQTSWNAWSSFMASRPEIQRAMATEFESLVVGFASRGGSGQFSHSITGVKLNELESMRLTLHGCHSIDIEGEYEVTTEGSNKIVRLKNVHFVWVDEGDMHPGVGTQLDSGEIVEDEEFTGVGQGFPIRIHFYMPRTSTWRVSGGTATHERGWPPSTGAPAAGIRE
jgi:hypothetical protein